VVAENADFEAAASKIGDATQRRFGTKSGKDCFPTKAGFFLRADYFEADFRFLQDAADKGVAILCFARSAGGDGTVASDTELVHYFTKMFEGFDAFLENFFAEFLTDENAFAKAERVALIVKRFDVDSGMGANDGKAYRVGTGVNRGDVDRL